MASYHPSECNDGENDDEEKYYSPALSFGKVEIVLHGSCVRYSLQLSAKLALSVFIAVRFYNFNIIIGVNTFNHHNFVLINNEYG